jgi:hypothetical protein
MKEEEVDLVEDLEAVAVVVEEEEALLVDEAAAVGEDLEAEAATKEDLPNKEDPMVHQASMGQHRKAPGNLNHHLGKQTNKQQYPC